MVTESQAEEWILDCDGSCRDVTFTPTTKEAVVDFLKSLLSSYTVTSAYNNNGIDKFQQFQTDDLLKDIDGSIHIILVDGDGIIPHLQVFIDNYYETDRYDVEVTFFPNDIDKNQFSLQSFRSLVKSWNNLLNSDDYFVRYENASWNLYDPMGLGVIYSRNQQPVG